MARALEAKPKKYDETKLAAMVAPFNVRIEKIRGNTRSPIPLPEADDGMPGGTGWDLDTVRQLEQWLVTEWSGGGLYEITLTDSSPTPQSMTWQPYWDVKSYPERTPPPLLEAASMNAPPMAQLQLPQQLPQQAQPQQGRNMPLFQNGLPSYPQQPQQPYAQFQQQPYFQTPPMPNAPMPGTHQWDAYQREIERREREGREREQAAQLRQLHEEKEKMQRDAIAAQHTAALERERQANAQQVAAQAAQLAELRNMVAGLATAIKDGANQPRTSPELDAIREQNRALEAKMNQERQERESRDREQATRDMIAKMEQNQREQMAEMRRQMDAAQAAALAAQANKGPDQFIMMMQNQQREQAEVAKEMSRNQLAQMQALQQYMMNPRDMMAMAKESAVSVDHAIERSTNFFGKVIETQQKVTENLLQMQPSSNGVVELVGNGMDRVASLGERYLSGKQLETQLTAQGQVQVAEAQARAYAQTMIAAQEQQIAAAAAAAEAAKPQPTNGLGSVPPVQQAQPQAEAPRKKKKAKPEPEVTSIDANKRRLGKTDQEWFGAIMPQVQELRSKANQFIEAIRLAQSGDTSKLDKAGNPTGWAPEQSAMAVVQAVGIVVQKQISIPVLMELLFQDRFADFVDVLLPEPIVTQQYRDEVVQLLVRHARVASGLPADGPDVDASRGEEAEDGDEAEDEDEIETASEHEDLLADDAEDPDAEPNSDKATDGKVVQMIPPSKKPAPAPARRA